VLDQLRFEDDAERLARERGWPVRVATPPRVNRVDVSRTSEAEVAALLEQGAVNLGMHQAATRRGKSEAEVAGYYGALYSVTRYETPSTFVCELPDALVVGEQGVVVSADGEVLVQSSLYGGARGARVALTLNGDAIRAATTLPGRYVSLVSYDAHNYAHWLLDCLPRLTILPADDGSWSVLVPAEPRSFHLESLRLLGIDDDRIVEMPAAATRVESLVLAAVAARTTRPAPDHLLELRRRLLAGAGAAEGHRRLYVSRTGVRRHVVDEHRLGSVLERYGFELVRPERLSFAEQVRTFAAAETVLGAHGAGIHNHLFAAPGSDVVEIFSPGYLYLAVQRTAAIAGQRHWHLFGDPAGEEYAIRVDPAKVDDLLALVLE